MKQNGKNTPYVHPQQYSDGRNMLNTVGNDGYSFDEKDDDEDDLPWDNSEAIKDVKEMKRAEIKAAQASMAEDYNNLSSEQASKMSDEELCRLYDAAMAEKDEADDQFDS